MKTRLPTDDEIAELVAFLPRLYGDGVVTVEQWGGGTQDQEGVLTLPWPEYSRVVLDFFAAAGRECWCDYDYEPTEAARMLVDENVVRNASLAQVKTMLTFCVRGERLCDGHWATMIEEGHVRRLLERLAKLGEDDANT